MLTETKPSGAGVDRALRSRESIAERLKSVRVFSRRLVEPLSPEDCVVQSMPDASPAKWHLAHTTWFFEALALKPFAKNYQIFHEQFNFLYNSYYNALGERHPRPRRGMITRPSLDEVLAYRQHVDDALESLVHECADEQWPKLSQVLEIGLNHEQQHQELLLTDIKHLLSCNPLRPAYRKRGDDDDRAARTPPLNWVRIDEGVYEIGYEGDGFAYDNEGPRHRVFLERCAIASRLVTNGEFLTFIEDGGYDRPEYWLDEGWATVNAKNWRAPLYWYQENNAWRHFTLNGAQDTDPNEPVSHVSLFEADAYARWAGARLATEEEWETAANIAPIAAGNFVESGALRPRALAESTSPTSIEQLYGDVWEWTRSQYEPYPGYRPPEGAIGEYNGKFMCNQFVLRGGSCATSHTHIRQTYRNFFHPAARWQFSGIRLAKDER